MLKLHEPGLDMVLDLHHGLGYIQSRATGRLVIIMLVLGIPTSQEYNGNSLLIQRESRVLSWSLG